MSKRRESGTSSSKEQELTEEKWQAILGNDPSYDGHFFYAVKSTGIFCRPSCKSKAPKRENVRIFASATQALQEQFRPCKRCKPTGERLPDEEWVAVMTAYIDRNYSEPISLEFLAEMCHGSPYHLHRTFKKVMAITPTEYLRRTRIARARQYLVQTDQSIAEIGAMVGLPNTSYFITLFKRITGGTPAGYRQRNKVQQAMNPDMEGANDETEQEYRLLDNCET
ncbi:bifunctional transcriptional activator/DNA repair enzyme AdaA [Paenibacillus caui]|uniref:bifunctional transcriptional activator/DNA repair enzyme AdaA n=1 Tax=Paenibacillus caui TaxID=2873927 RepID=UPI001CAA11FA|nr:bifunctional transcriptional activator/DNA repair enzyme AdaA [Paenibacillus caui]